MYKDGYIIEETESDFYKNEEIADNTTDKCCLCDEVFDTNDLKLICEHLVCKECEVNPDTIFEFVTIENAISWYVKKGYVK